MDSADTSDAVPPESALEIAIRLAGGQKSLALLIAENGHPCTQQAVSWWLNKAGHLVPAHYCRPIELGLRGAVTRADLRPDLFADQARAA